MKTTGFDIHKNKIVNFAFIIVIVLIAYNFIYKIQLQDIEELKKKKNVEIKKKEVLVSISQLERRINAYKSLLAKRDKDLIIANLGNLAKESKIKIISIKPRPEQRYADYIMLPFDLVVTAADYHTLGWFISKIESHRDIYLIEAANVRSETRTGGLTVNLTLNSIIYTDK